MSFVQPPRRSNSDGALRRVGLEIEYANVEPRQVVQDIIAMAGGTHEEHNPFLHKIINTRLGDFTVELDSILLSSRKYHSFLQKMGVNTGEGTLGKDLETLLSHVATTVVPYELVSPPIPLDQLGIFEQLRHNLYKRGAMGSKATWRFAFGLHFNPEVPSGDASTITAFLQAFCVLYPWLFQRSSIDYSRRVMPYIDPFPGEYVKLILQPGYRPDLATLINDYLRLNATRNRPLDMLPLFSHLAKDIVARYPIETELNKSRPTFHYRLPNSLVDNSDWRIAHEWNLWVEVEKLAADRDKRTAMAQEMLEIIEAPLEVTNWQWPTKVEQWLNIP